MQAGLVTTGDSRMQHDGDFVSRLYLLETVTE